MQAVDQIRKCCKEKSVNDINNDNEKAKKEEDKVKP